MAGAVKPKLYILCAVWLLAGACAGETDSETVLRRGNGGDPGSLDPALAAWAPSVLLGLAGGYFLMNLRT